MSTAAIGRSDICAVVVTYFPKPESAENLAALAPQVGKLVIVDNGSSEESLGPVAVAGEQLGATIVRLGSNLGIATALNAGLTYAREHGFRWLATFDQDSRCTPGMIEEMSRAFASYPQPGKLVVISPRHIDKRLGRMVGERRGEVVGEGWRLVPSAMTSGNLVNVELAAAGGGFDDSLFIDCVDHEFCFRLRRQGYRILEATHATLLHSLGTMEYRRFLFRLITITNHPVVRRYYMSRNRLILWREYWRHEPFWVIRDIRRFVFDTAYVVLYEKQVRAKFPMILRGLRDGLRNVRGAYDPRR
jgi:rhamnosyltransferase